MERRRLPLWIGIAGMGLLFGCESAEPVPTSTYFDRKIEPLLAQSCSNSPTQSGCHVPADNKGNAFGNLDVSDYESLSLRSDLLLPYGPYRLPALLVKAVPPFQLSLTNWEGSEPSIIKTDVPHAGGSLLDTTSASYTQLVRWLERGATENNVRRESEDLSITQCTQTIGTDPLFDPSVAPADPDFNTFVSKVNPILGERCAAGNCHGSPSNSLYLTCGKNDEQRRWNYFVASDYVSVNPDSSELLRRALAVSAGGVYHEGGDIFGSSQDGDFRKIRDWAAEKGGPTHVPLDAGFRFFAERVQPMLVKRGCMLIGCHSPAMGHEYRLRGGSGGHFGLPATRRNYQLSLEQVALESPDPNASRILRKNLFPAVVGGTLSPDDAKGITHRGGALFGNGRDDCDLDAAQNGPIDEQPPYCVIRAWIEFERGERMASANPLSAIVYVSRPTVPSAPQDFQTFVGGADLRRATASLAADGALSVSSSESLLGQCGLGAGGDVRRPAVSWDGTRIAFSARASAGEPWRIHVIDGAGCSVEPTIDAAPIDSNGNALPDNGELVHNFDPAFAPDGRIVFSSTRGNVMNTGAFSYSGPQRTPADPARLNANLYVAENGTVRQMTFLLNQELTPSFMSDGRLILSTEKRAPGFYQIAGRRQNLDGGDYHPLFGQRATIGYHQVTSIVELADKNFAAIFSDRGAGLGSGALGIVNRSIGIDQRSDDPSVYLQDPAAMDWQNPLFFQRSMRVLDGAGRPGEGGSAYRDPSPLPNGSLIVSAADGVGDVASFAGGFDLYVVDPVTSRRSGPVLQDANNLLWPVAVYARPNRGVFVSKLDEPNGASHVVPDSSDAEVLFLDMPLLTSLLFQNTRSKRVIPQELSSFEVWESLPPEPGVTSFGGAAPFVANDEFGDVYVRRRYLGRGTPQDDGSVRALVPGGMPILLSVETRFDGEKSDQRHQQREEMQFYPGERVRQGFRRDLFNGVCGSCHGSVSGYESHVAVNPDILTQASDVAASTRDPVNLTRGTDRIEGPPVP